MSLLEMSLPEMNAIWQDTLDWQPSLLQEQQFQQLYGLILAGNQQLNLTRITEPIEFWEKHLWDSLRGIFPQQNPSLLTGIGDPHASVFKAIDIGTGAGFPGIPVAIAQPTWQVTLLDATRKKVTFLNSLLTTLDLQNVKGIVDRVEQTGQQPHQREHYELALVRALGSASVCAEYALPLLKLRGVAVLYRGQWTDEDTAILEPALAQLGGTIALIESFKTPISQSDRHCLYLQKIAPTPPEFPRAIGIPTQKPL